MPKLKGYKKKIRGAGLMKKLMERKKAAKPKRKGGDLAALRKMKRR